MRPYQKNTGTPGISVKGIPVLGVYLSEHTELTELSGTGIEFIPNLTEVTGTGIEAVPNLAEVSGTDIEAVPKICYTYNSRVNSNATAAIPRTYQATARLATELAAAANSTTTTTTTTNTEIAENPEFCYK